MAKDTTIWSIMFSRRLKSPLKADMELRRRSNSLISGAAFFAFGVWCLLSVVKGRGFVPGTSIIGTFALCLGSFSLFRMLWLIDGGVLKPLLFGWIDLDYIPSCRGVNAKVKNAVMMGDIGALSYVSDSYRIAAYAESGIYQILLERAAEICLRRAADNGDAAALASLNEWFAEPTVLTDAEPQIDYSRLARYVSKHLFPGEEIRYATKEHWIKQWRPRMHLVSSIAVTSLLLVFGVLFDSAPVVLVSALLGITYVAVAIFSNLRASAMRRSTEIVVTNKRIIQKRGIFERDVTPIMLPMISNVKASPLKTWSRVLGFGTVEIVSQGGVKQTISDIENPMKLAEQIDLARIAS